MRSIEKLFKIIVLLIGVYMLVTYLPGGWNTPPALSGIAFTLLGIGSLIR